ncbi:glyoxalase [Flavobacterium sp. SM2513]|uniref:glyoxalase n=1 Tax=Flavobacterium sp. SM2513 TaxID=3424766 RepID=UPI003D7FB05B
MTTRDEFINQLRGTAFGKLTVDTSDEEFFQNETLRPIMKLQNDLLVAVFQRYTVLSKVKFTEFSNEKKLDFIENTIKKDTKFRNTLKGIVIGFFTLEEYNRYRVNSSALGKRITNLLIERLQSQVQLLEIP